MIYTADFISLEDDENDIILSFAIPDEDIGVKSLILYRTLFFEEFLPDEERGVKVSLEGENLDFGKLNMLESIELSNRRFNIISSCSNYVVDISKIDELELSKLKSLLHKQNYDNRFKIKNA